MYVLEQLPDIIFVLLIDLLVFNVNFSSIVYCI